MPSIELLTSISSLAATREAWLCDIWGVMHDGERPYAAAAEACRRFREHGGTVLLLSNAPRPAASVADQLDRIGVPRDAWDSILTSGDAARALIAERKGHAIYHLGPERDLPLFENLPVQLVAADAAEAIACTGLVEDERETADDYAKLLESFAARRLPMICANPDLTVERGGRIIPCAGALAAAYEKLGGTVSYAGKPYLPIYELALRHLAELRSKTLDPARILAIGDGIRTDIKGAAAAGLASIFVASAVHLADAFTPAEIAALFPDPKVRPIAAMPALAW